MSCAMMALHLSPVLVGQFPQQASPNSRSLQRGYHWRYSELFDGTDDNDGPNSLRVRQQQLGCRLSNHSSAELFGGKIMTTGPTASERTFSLVVDHECCSMNTERPASTAAPSFDECTLEQCCTLPRTLLRQAMPYCHTYSTLLRQGTPSATPAS